MPGFTDAEMEQDDCLNSVAWNDIGRTRYLWSNYCEYMGNARAKKNLISRALKSVAEDNTEKE